MRDPYDWDSGLLGVEHVLGFRPPKSCSSHRAAVLVDGPEALVSRALQLQSQPERTEKTLVEGLGVEFRIWGAGS